jgi:protein-S-isoprenylcysteine O-methyltransferase Ste14
MAAWSVLHSWLAAYSTKRISSNLFGNRMDRYYRLFFVGLAVLTLLPILGLIILLPSDVLWIISSPWLYLTVLLQVLAVVGALVTILQTDVMAFIGIRQALHPDQKFENKLILRGFYKVVRHPMYLFGLIILWLIPYMTDLLLAWVIASTLYFIFGSIPEEQKLLSQFGDDYQKYRNEIPWLIPGLKFKK